MSARDPRSTMSLTNLLSLQSGDSFSTTHIPSEEALVDLLAQRWRIDLPYTELGSTTLVVLNPLRSLANVNDASAREYEKREYGIVRSGEDGVEGGRLQPHLYGMAGRAYLMMRRTGESQGVVYSGVSGSGKTSSMKLFTSQVLRLASRGKRDAKIADQVRAIETLLDSFATAKTIANTSASRCGRFLELHFSAGDGRLAGAKVLTFGLDKSRASRLAMDERSFNIFYQLVSGTPVKERSALGLLDEPGAYAFLAASGSLLLPGGPHSNDTIAMDGVRDAFKTLGFKAKTVTSICRLLSSILLLGNITFADSEDNMNNTGTSNVSNQAILSQAADLLGVEADELEKVLTNRTAYVRRELCTVLLRADGAASQRNSIMSAVYSILFAYVIETANHRLFPGDEAVASMQAEGAASIVQLDLPGFQTKSPLNNRSSRQSTLLQSHAHDGFEEFCINYGAELVQCWLTRNTFEDSQGKVPEMVADGVQLPTIDIVDGSARLELLRGGLLGGKADSKPGGIVGGLSKVGGNFKKGRSTEEEAQSDFLTGMRDRFATHTSFISTANGNPSSSVFGIKHYASSVSYDASSFIESDLDLVDPDFVTLLRSSQDAFVAKLFSGPSIAAEAHPMDPSIIVTAQVSSQPMRTPTSVKSLSVTEPVPDSQPLEPSDIHTRAAQLNANVSQLVAVLEKTRVWSVYCLLPSEGLQPNALDARRVKMQVKALELANVVARRRLEYVQSVPIGDFCKRHCPDQSPSLETAQAFAASMGWVNVLDYAIGREKMWLSFSVWKELEDSNRADEPPEKPTLATLDPQTSQQGLPDDHLEIPMGKRQSAYGESADDLLLRNKAPNAYYDSTPITPGSGAPSPGYFATNDSRSFAASVYDDARDARSDVWGAEWGGKSGDIGGVNTLSKEGGMEAGVATKEKAAERIEEVASSRTRRYWVNFVWFMTWWIPSIALSKIGRMKRPDVQLAWREKLTICFGIFFLCAFIIFYIIFFGKLLCPNFDKAWNLQELGYHQGQNDFWVGVRGEAYDITNFWRGQHSDIVGQPVTTDDMLQLAGQDLTGYFPIPLTLACQGLVTNNNIQLTLNFTPTIPTAIHTSGKLQAVQASALADPNWYVNTFLPKMNGYAKGPIVYSPSAISDGINSDGKTWAIYQNGLYDLSDYLNTVSLNPGVTDYSFLPKAVTDLWQQQPGQDLTSAVNSIDPSVMNDTLKSATMACLRNTFYVGETDFRLTARCQVQSYLLLAFSAILVATILAKFLAALQLGTKKFPELQDKFVICQVPCYTEGEESLKKTIDSLAALNYDDKRKLIFVICDGMIIGSGNDRPTPRIVCDILGVDPKAEPEPLLMKSIGEGSAQLNYGKVWSGLYEYEGHVVPYVIVAKVGKPSERSKPGNRGKRDSQILVMRFLNRVHFDTEMNPLELEMYHQIKNVIGVDPTLFEYLFCVDADTDVAPDSLNRLVSSSADDGKIIGICGETKLSNEQASWWTMIQVYEYYISHHLAKAFESLFGSVTCLPGCFSMYRLRTQDKGRPLLISNLVIDDYSENHVDTLHKKNLFSLGEDRYLTTLILKHFPNFKTKFIPDARAFTTAPDKWGVLLSQRRRWINSTVHNLVELTTLKDMCGFCCFSMRFIVLLDLLGTLMLPATTIYLVYLIVTVATGSGSIPIISLVMIGAVYGLQAIIFLLKRQWQFIGWLVIYILAYPVYSFFLPVYSFWHMDDFSWGNTRVVVGEGKNKKVLAGTNDEPYDDSMIPMRKFSEYQEMVWETGSNHSKGSYAQSSVGGFSLATRHVPAASVARSFAAHSVSGDYYRDGKSVHSRVPSRATMLNVNVPTPAAAFSPWAGSMVGSVAGSEYGGMGRSRPTSMFSSNALQTMTDLGNMNAGARESYASFGNPFAGAGMHSRNLSSYSVGTANPFISSSVNPTTNPSDAELTAAIRAYLSTQDLMQVTKRTAREAVQAQFPNADLSSRKAFLNNAIDTILQA